MSGIKKQTVIGFAAGLIAGIAYGTNPLFGKDLLIKGVPVMSILFFRYLMATGFMIVLMLCKKESFKLNLMQLLLMAVLGILFACSSICLFAAYNFIAAGLATTLLYIYPVFTALLMILLHVYPSWRSWLCIAISIGGVVAMVNPFGTGFNITGLVLCLLSALSYALYLVIVNRSKIAANLSADTISFYALIFGTLVFFCATSLEGNDLTSGISGAKDWIDLIALAIIPTMMSLLALSMSTRMIGPTRTAVLGVSEPLTAILIGTFIFSEPFTFNIALGTILCIVSILFMVVSGEKGASKGISSN